MKSKCVSDLLWILAHFGSHISDSPYLLEHIVEEHLEGSFTALLAFQQTRTICFADFNALFVLKNS